MMSQKIYLEGFRHEDGSLRLPIVSSALLFVSRYCLADHFKYFVVKTTNESENDKFMSASFDIVEGLQVEYTQESCVPYLVKNCMLPVGLDEVTSIIRSGLCGTVRYIIQSSHDRNPSEAFKDLLGFRNGSLRMCAEVSGWTKLCELELPGAIHQLIDVIKKLSLEDNLETEVEIPIDLMKLEMHFEKPPKIHNDHKIKKHILIQNRDEILNPENGRQMLESCCRNRNDCLLERDISLSHGFRRYRIYKNSENTLYLKSDRSYTRERLPKFKQKNQERPITRPVPKTDTEKAERRKEKKKRKFARRAANHSAEIMLEKEKMNHLEDKVNNLCIGKDNSKAPNINRQEPYSIDEIINSFKTISTLDVEFVHLYTEGLEMTVADLILFVYCYFLMESLNFQNESLSYHLPHITSWLDHMISLPRIQEAARSCNFVWRKIADSKSASVNEMMFIMPTIPVTFEDEMELCRRNKTSVRAIKPEVTEILKLIQNGNIEVILGEHPRKDDVSIDWSDLPVSVHPQDGDVPVRRIERKCQQLENLVTAVLEISKPRDIIVDFCSGGGHLGIVLAYLLPDCKVYLIENKEESIERARTRVDNLHLNNVVVYQCNLDYFHGYFDIGVCLHACGVATDMVLHQCLHNKAAFVICPCCYGHIVKTHRISYPRSEIFRDAGISYKDFVTLGHAADQTEFNMALANQGCYCANLVDTDRAEFAQEHNYAVTLCSLKPLSCTPKNNLLIGLPR